MSYECRIELDSISPAGARLTTFVVTYPRFVHSEMLTHRMFSRNSSSSRAIPVEKMIKQVLVDPAAPVWWGKNQPGMQAREELEIGQKIWAKDKWFGARDAAVKHAQELIELGAHKQIVNRLLEPWMWITVVISATEWENFFRLRCHPDAQPELRRIAEMMREAYAQSEPTHRTVHMPFRRPEDEMEIFRDDWPKICAARCARVSYLTHEGKRDVAADLELATRLIDSGHWSPFEHVARTAEIYGSERCGNFIGWLQLRAELDPTFIWRGGK